MSDTERRDTGEPLTTLWDDLGEFGRPVRDSISEDDIRELLRDGPVRFVVVDVGRPLRWIPLGERFDFWKSIRANLHVPEKPYLEDYPGSFFYFAAEWAGRGDECVIVVRVFH